MPALTESATCFFVFFTESNRKINSDENAENECLLCIDYVYSYTAGSVIKITVITLLHRGSMLSEYHTLGTSPRPHIQLKQLFVDLVATFLSIRRGWAAESPFACRRRRRSVCLGDRKR